MRIAILIKDFDMLENWELRIIEYILQDPTLNLVLLVKDGRRDGLADGFAVKIKNLLKSKKIASRFLFAIQRRVEQQIYKKRFTVDKSAIIKQLEDIKTIYLYPAKINYVDRFSDIDRDILTEYDLDVILRFEFNIIRGAVLEASRYGIWSFHHADNSINRGGPAGFWEIVLNQPVVGVTLQVLTPELDGGLVIDKAYFNRYHSFVKTNQHILESSVSLFVKNIKRLQSGYFKPTKSLVYYNPLYRLPDPWILLRYIFGFYMNISIRVIKRLSIKLFDIRYRCWSLFIGYGQFMTSTLYRLTPVELPKNSFWADPFIVKYKSDYYIFFENYDYRVHKGKISCGKIEGNTIVDVVDVLDRDYHLSYPYIFRDGDDMFMIPESHQNRRLDIYRCVKFPLEWELYSSAFEGESVVDAIIHTDSSGEKWLFLNKSSNIATVPFENELYIYKIDSLKMNKVVPHRQNPVIIDSSRARNGGAVFEYENEFYRPSQASIDTLYGKALNINRIKKLTLDEYEEETIVTVEPNFYKNLDGIHHMHQLDDVFVIDASYRYLF